MTYPWRKTAVLAATGDMSVALDQAQNLPKPRLPKSLGGEGRDPVFQMFSDELSPTLAFAQTVTRMPASNRVIAAP